jgi:hypothetical protein
MEDLRRAAIDVVRKNESDGYTAPARELYTHQHLWDTCFIAIGQRHYDAGGAMTSLRRLLRAQWRNGMIPHIIFEPGWRYWWDRRIWRNLRWDTKYVPAGQRSSTVEALRLYDAFRRIRKEILIRANALLKQITRDIGVPLPASLESAMRKNEEALESLWDQTTESYYSRDVRTGALLKEQSIAALMPLYSGCIAGARAERLVSMLADPAVFGSPYPVPSVPLGSRWFRPTRYWQGPAWVNMNWLIIDGLHRYGFTGEADALRLKTLEMVEKSGFYEYYHPGDGEHAGVKDFSWTLDSRSVHRPAAGSGPAAPVDDQVIGSGLPQIRQLWDAGLGAPRHQARQPDGRRRPITVLSPAFMIKAGQRRRGCRSAAQPSPCRAPPRRLGRWPGVPGRKHRSLGSVDPGMLIQSINRTLAGSPGAGSLLHDVA